MDKFILSSRPSHPGCGSFKVSKPTTEETSRSVLLQLLVKNSWFFCNYGFFYIGPIQEINATLERASSLPLPLPVESCPEDILEGTNLSGNLEVSQSGHEQLKSRWHQQQHQTDQTWYSTSLNPHLKLYLRPHFFLTFGLARAHLADFWRETQGLNGHFA